MNSYCFYWWRYGKTIGTRDAYVISSPSATVMPEIPRVRVIPVPEKLVAVAPLTVTSPCRNVLGSALNVRVNTVVPILAVPPPLARSRVNCMGVLVLVTLTP